MISQAGGESHGHPQRHEYSVKCDYCPFPNNQNCSLLLSATDLGEMFKEKGIKKCEGRRKGWRSLMKKQLYVFGEKYHLHS